MQTGRPEGVPPEALAMGPWHDVPGLATGEELKLSEVHKAQVNAQMVADTWRSNWDFACSEYLRLAASARSQGWPAPKKPIPDEPQMLLRMQEDGGTGLVWYWKEPQMMPVCPDLPPLAPVVAGNVAIGNHLCGNYWQALHEDTVSRDSEIVGTSADGVSGAWRRLTAMGMGGMGWYQLIERLGK